MKKIILGFAILFSSCNASINNNKDTVTNIKKCPTYCIYEVCYQGSHAYFASEFKDDCGKFQIGDTVFISNKRQ